MASCVGPWKQVSFYRFTVAVRISRVTRVSGVKVRNRVSVRISFSDTVGEVLPDVQ